MMDKPIKLQDFQITLQTRNTKGKIKYVHFKRDNSPIYIKLCSRSGSRFDPEGKEGLAHFVEHVVLNGTEKFIGKRELSQALDNIGGSYSAQTGYEYTCFNFLIANKSSLPLISDVSNQILRKPSLLEDKISSEKKVVQSEISSKIDDKKRVLSNGVKSLIYGDRSIARSPSGSKESIELINREDILTHLEHTLPNYMTVVSCGDCDITDIINNFDDSIPYCEETIINDDRDRQHSDVKHGVTKMRDQKLIYCSFAFPTCSLDSKDWLPLNIISTYLGKGRSSLLKEILRYKNNLIYSTSSGNDYFSDSGYFFIEASMKKENLEPATNKIVDMLTIFLNNGIEDNDLSVVKNKIINSSIISTQTVQSWVNTHFYRQLLIRDSNYYYNDFLNDVKNITKEQIKEVANKYLTKDKMHLYAVGNLEISEIENIIH